MSICVNISSKEFKDAATRLDINETTLEGIVHEFINTVGNENSFPTDSYIMSKVEGVPFESLSKEETDFIKKKGYDKPWIFDSREDALAHKAEVARFFDPKHIGFRQLHNGKYQVELQGVETAIEMQTIKDEAIKNGTFMKAPNGEDTKLTEKQWLQVRTKNFLKWFGNWQKQFVVYQGRRGEKDSRKFNYYTLSEREAKNYGNSVERTIINTENFLSYYGEQGRVVSDEFYNKTGKRFDILDNSTEGIKTQEEFFEFVKAKGYQGLDLLSDNFLGREDIENPYLVTFDNYKDPKSISKVIDNNGEPLVVYHGSPVSNIEVFNNKNKRYNVHRDGIFFSENKESASTYMVGEDSSLYEAFLDIKNMETTSYNDDDTIETLRDRENRAILNPDNDGVKMITYDKVGFETQYVVKKPNQIKSATENNGNFSKESDNIRLNKNLRRTFFQHLETLNKLRDRNGNLTRPTVLAYNQQHGTNFGLNPRTGELTYKDARIDGVSIYNPHDTQIVAKRRIDRAKLLEYLGNKFNLQFKEVAPWIYDNKMGKQSNCCVIGDTVYVRQRDLDRLTNEQLIEEFVHPVVNAIYNSNKGIVEGLLQEARRLFPDLCKQIEVSYKDRGRQVQEEEIIAQVLAKYVNREISDKGLNTRNLVNYIEQLVDKIVSALRDLFGNVSIGRGERITISGRDIKEVFSFQNLAELINSKEVSFNDKLIERDYRNNLDNTFGVATDEDGLSRPEPEKVREHLVNFQKGVTKFSAQLSNLLNSGRFNDSDIRKIGKKVASYISKTLTDFLQNPEDLLNKIDSLGVKDGKPLTEEERQTEINKIRKMSRIELINYVTLPKLLEFIKLRLFDPKGNTALNNGLLVKKAKLISQNFDAILSYANDAFLQNGESFALVSNTEDFTVREVEQTQQTSEDFSKDDDNDTAQELGNLQEHWQIESRTQDVLSTMTQMVKQELDRLIHTKVDPATGNVVESADEFGLPEVVGAKDATSSILRWVKGAESLSHMFELLEEKAEQNPWINPIINKLKDTSGKETDFQSQFYGAFAKAFQPYTVVIKERGKDGEYRYKSIEVNQHPAYRDAKQEIEVAYNTNLHPLFDAGKLRKEPLAALTAVRDNLVQLAQKSLEENDRLKVADLLYKAITALGYTTDLSTVVTALDSNGTFLQVVNNLNSIVNALNNNIDKENYNPFTFGEEGSITGFLKNLLTPITNKLEDTAVSSFYDSGKMYQSWVTPSYLTVMMNKFHSDDSRFQQFIESEYGQYEWFRNPDGSWKNMWLETIANLSQEKRQDLFRHKVQLNFNKHNYMKNMDDVEYALSVLAEYASEMATAKGTVVPVWYRIPMMSNKPSSEFLRMYAYIGSAMKPNLLRGFSMIFQQELGRIQTVDIRDYKKSDPNFIKSFDKNGRKFMMLDFLNVYLRGGSRATTELGRLINKAIEEGTSYDAETNKGLTAEENSRMDDLVKQAIDFNMEKRADTIISQWKENGIFEGAKRLANFGTEATLETKLREFIWNDAFAAMNILELTITDPAFYKDAEDLQKRLAQIHAPGTRANVEARDYNGNRVTDGKFRTVLLKDFDDFKSNIIENLTTVFDRKLAALEKAGFDRSSAKYKAEKATYDNIIQQFHNINVADAQGYSSPTSYRKKAFIFGRWSREAEEIYNKLKSGNYNYGDLKTAFQPLKPFVYGQIEKPSIDADRSTLARPMSKLKVPVQFKNSEYLLVMADAILRNEDTGRPNLLRAVYDIMEDSAEKNKTLGIDTIQFESTCKSGLMAPIDINQFSNSPGGETAAYNLMNSCIYEKDGTYSKTYVYEVPFENYAIQQEVPSHFKNHYQAHGSQIRYIIISDLESVDFEGNPVTYDYFDRGEKKSLSADEFKAEYENTIAANIEDSLNLLSEELGIGNYYLSRKDRNIALSKVLLDEVRSSPRYGSELALACTIDDTTGEFNIPLGDPIQAKRVEQLLNSVVKNRINKQEIAGGPVVQVSNFGTSKELNIRYKDKKGNLLMTKAEFAKTAPQNGKQYDIDAAYQKYCDDNQAGIAYLEVFAPIYSNDLFKKFADWKGNIDIDAIEAVNPDLLKMIGYRIPTEDKYSMMPLKIVGFLPREAGDGIMLPNDITLLTGSDFDIDKFYLMRKEMNLIKQADGSYTTVEPTEGSTYRNNKIVDMSWAVLTNATTADKMLNPGGFEPEKSMGYLVSAYQNPSNKFTWQQLEALADGAYGLLDGELVAPDPTNKDIEMGTDALKTLCYTDKNLSFIDTHLQFYKQNSAAATALGMAAVQKVGHAVLESNGFRLDIASICDLENGEEFVIADKSFSGMMEIDTKYNDEGALIGRTLGEFVAMFADAVKDPVANLMNINNSTMPLVTAMIRLGMPFKSAALFISQPIIKQLLNEFNARNISEYVTLADIAREKIENIEETYGITDDSNIKTLNNITREELIRNLNPKYRANDANATAVSDYKVLNSFLRLNNIAAALKAPTYVTRFNSISNAVGPLIIDNLIMEHKLENGDFSNFYDNEGNNVGYRAILDSHPILNGFYQALEIAQDIFDGMPVNSESFRRILNQAEGDTVRDLQEIIYSDRKILSNLSDFYQSYLLVASGAIETVSKKPFTGLKYYVNEFPKDFMRGKAKEIFKGNALIDAIKLDYQNDTPVLVINTVGMDNGAKETLSSGWRDLYYSGERGKQLATHLFYYNFFRTGIGFSPKSFMGLFPTMLKKEIPGYLRTFTVKDRRFAENVSVMDVLDQFVRNNADDNKLVSWVKIGKEDGTKPKVRGNTYEFNGNDFETVKNKPYLKAVVGKDTILLRRDSKDSENKVASYTKVSILGDNGKYFEVSTDSGYAPMANTTAVTQQIKEGEMETPSTAETETQEVPTKPQPNTPTRTEKIRGMLLKMFMMTGRTEEQATAKINELKAKDEKTKEQLKNPMKKFMKEKFKELGIDKYDDKLLDEMYEELC